MNWPLFLVLLVGSVWGVAYVSYKTGERPPLALYHRVMQSNPPMTTRMLAFVVFGVLSFMQMGLASEVFTDATNEGLANLGGLGLSPWNLLLYLMIVWLWSPILLANIELWYGYRTDGTEVLEGTYWSETA